MGENTATSPTRRASRLPSLLAFALLFVLAATSAMTLQNRRLRRVQEFRPYIDSLFVPRAGTARLMSFGYNLFAADFLYLRSIQAFGGQWRRGIKNYENIFHYFDTIAEVDPHFIEAYEFGSLIIGEEAGQPRRAIELNAKGAIKNPDKYRLPFLNVYTAWWSLKDRNEALHWIDQTLKADDCPEYVERFEDYINKETGRFELALDGNIGRFLHARLDGADHVVGLTRRKFSLITDEWNLKILHDAVEEYRKNNDGEIPASLGLLAQSGHLTGYRGCDYPRLEYRLERTDPGAEAEIEKAQERIVAECVREMSGVPAPPYRIEGHENFYLVRKNIEPKDHDVAIKNKRLVLSAKDAREETAGYLRALRKGIDEFRRINKRNPIDLNEAFPDGVKVRDPLLGTDWVYDTITGLLLSPGFPDM